MPAIESVGCVLPATVVTAVATDAIRVTTSVTGAPLLSMGLATILIGVVLVCWPAANVSEGAMETMLPTPVPVRMSVTTVEATGG